MSLKRILKLLAAFITGQGVTVLTQLLVPPLFLHRYEHGIEIYGEWVALSAAVAYLNTLNFGIQNYANNQMAIHYNRGEVDEAKAVQASALRLLLVTFAVLSVVTATVLLMPLSEWLGLTHISDSAADWTVFLLVLQLLVSWCFALLVNSYLVIGEAHRSQNWTTAQRVVATLALAVLLWRRASFPVLALSQLATIVVFTSLAVVDVRRRAPILLPGLRYGSWQRAVEISKPTAYFMLLAVSGFLTWQGPVLLIQKILGSTAVAIFSLSRIVFSMSRQILAILTYSISQDITHLYGQRNWVGLKRLYELSEKVILLADPTVSVGTLLLGPFLFTVWLHNRGLFNPEICVLMGIISAVIGIKEHKYQFQWSSNEHTALSRFMLGAYTIMLAMSAVLLKPLGIQALLIIWMITEMILVIYILRLNMKLFPADMKISVQPVIRLGLVLAVAFGVAAWPVHESMHWGLATVVGVACVFSSVLAVVCYFAFGLREVREVLESRLRRRMTQANSA